MQLAGATTLALLCKKASLREAVASRESIPALLSAMRNVRHDKAVQRAAMKALFRMSFSSVVRDTLSQRGGDAITHIVEAMRFHPDDGPLQRMAIVTLLQLSKQEGLLKIAQRDAVSYVILAMNNFASVDNVAQVS